MKNMNIIYELPTMKAYDISKIVDKLSNVIIDDSGYEVTPVEGFKFVFVVGCNEEERDLQPWDHPIIVDGVRDEKIMVLDVRRYMQQIKEKPIMLTEVVKDISGLRFTINRAIFLSLISEGMIGKFRQVQNSVATIFANMLTTTMAQYVDLNPREKLLVETVASGYVHNKFLVNYSDNEKAPTIKSRLLHTKLSLPNLKKKELDDLFMDIDITTDTFSGLVENLKNVIIGKKNMIDEVAMYNSMNGLFYGPGNVSTSIVHLEDLSTMITLYHAVLTDPTYKRTKIAMIANNLKKRIEIKEFEKLSNIIKEYSNL